LRKDLATENTEYTDKKEDFNTKNTKKNTKDTKKKNEPPIAPRNTDNVGCVLNMPFLLPWINAAYKMRIANTFACDSWTQPENLFLASHHLYFATHICLSTFP